MAGYNATRAVNDLLLQHEASPPSFTVNLYPEHWTLNNGSKFLYNNQVAVCIPARVIPFVLTPSDSRYSMIYVHRGYPWISLSYLTP